MAINSFPLKILSLILAPILLSPGAMIALEFPPTEGAGAPSGGTSGGGVRGSSNCVTPQDGLSLMVVRPLKPENYVGTTATDTPTMFFYVPQTKAQAAEFILVDAKGNDVYTQQLPLSGSGLVGVTMKLPQLPKEVPSTDYTWQFLLVCNSNDRGADMWVEGQIRHVNLGSDQIAALAAEKDLLKKAELLAKAEVWYDSVAIAVQLRSSDPKSWETLLKSVGLEKLTETPLVSWEN